MTTLNILSLTAAGAALFVLWPLPETEPEPAPVVQTVQPDIQCEPMRLICKPVITNCTDLTPDEITRVYRVNSIPCGEIEGAASQ